MAKKKKINRKLRARNAAIHSIMERENMTRKEVLAEFPNVRIEVLFKKPQKELRKRFLQVAPGKWKKIKDGKPPKRKFTYGKVHTVGDLSRIRKLQNYWSMVSLYADSFSMSINEARKRYGKLKDKVGVKAANKLFYEDLGVYAERYEGQSPTLDSELEQVSFNEKKPLTKKKLSSFRKKQEKLREDVWKTVKK